MAKTSILEMRAASVAANRARVAAERATARQLAREQGLPDPDGPPEFADARAVLGGIAHMAAQLDRIEDALVTLIARQGETVSPPPPPPPAVEVTRVLNPTP